MSKRTVVIGYHVVVEPAKYFWGIHLNDLKERCSEIVTDIKRHVDGVKFAHIVDEEEYSCEHCGNIWTGESDMYNGGCCDEDEKNNPESTTNKEYGV